MKESPIRPSQNDSLILRTVSQFLLAVLLLFSLFLLIRGHNAPGGGFTGGLVAASSFALYAIAYGPRSAIAALRIHPVTIFTVGLGMAICAAVFSLFFSDPLLTGLWTTIDIPGPGEVKLGSPFVFDIGVYFVVIGVTLLIILTLEEEEET